MELNPVVREVIELNVRHELTAGPARSGAGSARGPAIALAGHQEGSKGLLQNCLQILLPANMRSTWGYPDL